MLRSIRRLYERARKEPVDEELRGWNWDKPPLKPRAYLGLSVSEIASQYCQTKRDVWLRRVVGVKPDTTDPILRGKLVHEALNHAYRVALRYITQGLPGWSIYEIAKNKWREVANGVNSDLAKLVEKTYKSTLLMILGEYEYESSITGEYTPPLLVTEYRVDGSLLGLSSNLSVDAIAETVIIDYKYGAPRDFHKTGLAGYALALEAEYEVPFDYGLLVYINENGGSLKLSYRPVYISNTLRRIFIEERDNLIDMLLEKREPPRDTNCSRTCPFYRYCWGR